MTLTTAFQATGVGLVVGLVMSGPLYLNALMTELEIRRINRKLRKTGSHQFNIEG